MGLNPDYLLKSFSLYILLFVFLINHDILGNSFVAFEFSESFFMDMKIKRLTVLSVLNAYMCDNII